MTDRVAKPGIEDVLSSIKRLVSEDDRKASGVITPTIARKPSRLVLTDALRVNEPAVPKQSQPEKKETAYKAEDSVKPMLLRACDIVNHAEPAVEQQAKAETGDEDGLADSLSAKIEALEAAIAHTEDQWEPDGDSDDAYSGTPNKILEWHAEDEFIVSQSSSVTEIAPEQPEPEVKATFIRDPGSSSAAPTQPTKPDVENATLAMSEDALRDLIAQVVREELQGVLGQRITRNVRKMVRREIYRALAERELD
ncbi:hypothetical protein [Ruegeria arenilitoris]|uniref:hypothetical protein n=1 Tax=Ruegeria arenilitoris TaxID=1173585 RepID=UPI00147E1B0E|nr:hypothetical protein [Ruegeria arenilitoris]